MRRIPLLGQDDPIKVKQLRSFTVQAEQSIWDIGHPISFQFTKKLKISQFRHRLDGGEFPINQDHSGAMSIKKLSWTTEVQEIDFKDMLPKLIEGFSDEMQAYQVIAMTALKDAIKHGNPCDTANAIPYCVPAMNNVLKLYNETSSRLVLEFLKILLTECDYAGPMLALYLGKIFMYLNPFMIKSKTPTCNLGDNIYYKQHKSHCIDELIQNVMQLAEAKAGSEAIIAAIKLKEAIPTYQSQYMN